MYLDPSAGMIFSRSEKKGNAVAFYTLYIFVVFWCERMKNICILHLKRLKQFLINVGRKFIQHNP